MAELVLGFDEHTGTVSVLTSHRTERKYKGKSLVSFPDTYVVVDLETTGFDARFDSIIEIAGIKVSGGVEVDRFQSLVNPEWDIPEYISELTGITNEMVKEAPTIKTVLPAFLDFVGNHIVVGHNVHFDANFIYDTATWLGLPPFSNDLVDTARLSRRLYKDMENHKLPMLAQRLGVSEIVEHRALSDCLVTHGCLSKMKAYVEEIGGLPINSDHFNTLANYITPETTDFDPDSPIFGRSFAFTGVLERMTRAEAMQAVANAGGICCNGVVASTNYLVLGNNDYCSSIKGGKSAKQKKAEKMRLAGSDILVISEAVFYDMLDT